MVGAVQTRREAARNRDKDKLKAVQSRLVEQEPLPGH
jgi:hypothetical protein